MGGMHLCPSYSAEPRGLLPAVSWPSSTFLYLGVVRERLAEMEVFLSVFKL